MTYIIASLISGLPWMVWTWAKNVITLQMVLLGPVVFYGLLMAMVASTGEEDIEGAVYNFYYANEIYHFVPERYFPFVG